ncbi:hypothetical protein [Roseateles sp.]|uniref:hypothetical protein n=1 Tax=Roseateles sp. TaxID=1971397 RepID=UPI003BA77649
MPRFERLYWRLVIAKASPENKQLMTGKWGIKKEDEASMRKSKLSESQIVAILKEGERRGR